MAGILSNLSCRIKESSPAEQADLTDLFFRTFHRCDDHGEKPSFTRRTDNITQKISICKFNYTKNIYLFCYGNGGMRVAGGAQDLPQGYAGLF
jgi:hypothetical protein